MEDIPTPRKKRKPTAAQILKDRIRVNEAWDREMGLARLAKIEDLG